MIKFKRLFSVFFSILMLCMTLTPLTTMAASPATEGVNYIDIEVSLVPVDNSIMASNPLVGNAGMFNAFFNPGQTSATTNMAIFDFRLASLPNNAVVTNVQVTSVRTNVPGMTYFVQIGRGSNVNNFTWAPNITWASTVNTNFFNGQDPYAYWALRFFATRIITNPLQDFGAGATVTSATLRVFWN